MSSAQSRLTDDGRVVLTFEDAFRLGGMWVASGEGAQVNVQRDPKWNRARGSRKAPGAFD